MNKIKELLGSDKVKVIVAVTAAVVMYFTPDNIDKVIETLLVLFGVDRLVLKKNEDVPPDDKTKEER